MIRRIPVLPTLVVLIAAAVMVRLGVWQLERLDQKAAMIARYVSAQADPAIVDWNGHAPSAEALLYRRVRLDCGEALADHPVSGRNGRGEAGWVQGATCTKAPVRVVLGWTAGPDYRPGAPEDARLVRRWSGGTVTGWLAPGPRIVADPPLAGLQPNARPDPRDLPNNHLAYAVQWFAFAAVAVVIYGIALSRKHGG